MGFDAEGVTCSLEVGAAYQFTGVGTAVDTDGIVFTVPLFAATSHSDTGWRTQLNAF